MNNNIKFSLIIPAYNIESYISECLKSLVLQTLPQKNFEVILVDDCSSDKTLEITNNFSKSINLKIISNTTNEGPGYSRNSAINIAKGQYLVFLDADDMLTPNALELLYGKIKNTSADIIIYNWIDYGEYKTNTLSQKRYNYKIPSNSEEAIAMCIGLEGVDYTNNYKLVKRSIFTKNNLSYSKGLHEDIAMTFKLFYFSKLTVKIEDVVYVRRIRDGSTMSHFGIHHIDGLLNAWPEMLHFISSQSTKKEFSAILVYYYNGISGIIATILNKIKTNPDFLERTELYLFLLDKLSRDKNLNLNNLSHFPKNTKKDIMCNDFLKIMLDKIIPSENKIKEFESIKYV